METLLKLEKQTGSVTCDLPGLAALAQEELDRCIAVRTGSDVTRIVQRLFEKQADPPSARRVERTSSRRLMPPSSTRSRGSSAA
jgi:hypothetical protein